MDSSFKFLKGEKMLHPTTGITLEYLAKSDAVCIVLFNETKEKVILVKQYRPGPKGYMVEICAGLIDPGENPDEDLTDIKKLPHGLYVSPGYTTESLHFYGARLKSDKIKPKELSLDHGEDLKVLWVDVKDILNVTRDMKTVLAVTYFSKL